MKIAIYRPHVSIWFKNPVKYIVRRQRLPSKYESFLNFLLQSDHEIFFTTALFREKGLKNLLAYLWEPLELILWCLLNRISLKRVHLSFFKNSVCNADILFAMHYGNFTHEDRNIAIQCENSAKQLSELKLIKVLHMTHYAYNPTIGAANLRHLRPSLLVAENNLTNNSRFYKKYFDNLKVDFFQLAYVAAERFRRVRPFESRINKLIVTGSITFKMKDIEFKEFFNVDELQPLRRIIYELAGNYVDAIDSQISDLNASRTTEKSTHPFNSLLTVLEKIFSQHSQLNYYKQDIVETYNSYTMFTVPEEICNLPAIGFVEGMACGSAYLGLDDPMYRDLGLVSNVHYIAYDGSLTDLLAKVRYYQSHLEELKKIADSGYEFVKNNLTADLVYKKFMDKLKTTVACQSR